MTRSVNALQPSRRLFEDKLVRMRIRISFSLQQCSQCSTVSAVQSVQHSQCNVMAAVEAIYLLGPDDGDQVL